MQGGRKKVHLLSRPNELELAAGKSDSKVFKLLLFFLFSSFLPGIYIYFPFPGIIFLALPLSPCHLNLHAAH